MYLPDVNLQILRVYVMEPLLSVLVHNQPTRCKLTDSESVCNGAPLVCASS
jgi:hypothetical protein